jgi:hypothetical protein
MVAHKKVTVMLLEVASILMMHAVSSHAIPLKIYLLGGQSNMVGWASPSSDLPLPLQQPQADVMIYAGAEVDPAYAGYWSNLRPGFGLYRTYFGPEITFGRDMADKLGEKIALIKHAKGDTNLYYDWRPHDSGNGGAGYMYAGFTDTVANALASLDPNYEPEIVGMIWMQGESDAFRSDGLMKALAYEENLTNFIQSVRSDLGMPDLPFMIGQISDASIWTYGDIVQQAQFNVSQTVSNTALVVTTDLGLTDVYNQHYDSNGIMTLGTRFAESMSLLQNRLEASNPLPRNQAFEVALTTDMSWNPGKGADLHDVYFGTNYNDVNNATVATGLGVYRGNNAVQGPDAANRYRYNPGALKLNTTYYWRVDESDTNEPNGIPRRGPIWSFTVAGYIGVDDFESYTDDTDLRAMWNGNITLSTTKHNGLYAMRINNNSSAACTVIRSNWTEQGVKALVLYFHGDPNNTADKEMYVSLCDSKGASAVVTYGDNGEDIDDLRDSLWHEWNINLEEFSNGGVDLNNIGCLSVRFGDRIIQTESLGVLYVDDIRLYPPRCVAAYRAAGDITGDCVTDFEDLMIVTEDWLKSGYYSTGLIDRWEFNGDYNDTAGDNDGTPMGGASVFWDTSRGSSVLSLDGASAFVFIPYSPVVDFLQQFTISLWMKPSNNNQTNKYLLSFLDGGWKGIIYGYVNSTVEFFDGYAIGQNPRPGSQLLIADTNWHYIAYSYDGSIWAGYVDGSQVFAVQRYFSLTTSEHPLFDKSPILIGTYGPAGFFSGCIDDIRVYNHGLSAAEILDVMNGGDANQVYYPLLSSADLSGDNKIDLRDLAILANGWLEKRLWPNE